MINLNVLGLISNTFTVPILALLMTQIIINDTQVKNIGHICMTCKHFFFWPWLGPHAKRSLTTQCYAFCHTLHECMYYHISSSCTSDIMIFHCPNAYFPQISCVVHYYKERWHQ